MKKKNTLLNENTPIYQRWSVIIIAVLLIWPLGIILLFMKITGVGKQQYHLDKNSRNIKIPYARYKSEEKIRSYNEKHKHQVKADISTAIVAVLLLVLGCYGLTKDYIYLFVYKTVSVSLIQDILFQALFVLAGTYLAYRLYFMLLEQRMASLLLVKLGGKKSASMSELADGLKFNPEDVKEVVTWMLKMDYFGDNARLDSEEGTLYCV